MSLIDDLYRDYASAPVDGGHYVTVELLHPAFNYGSVPGAIRLVAGFVSITATLEETAPENPGETVQFIGVAMELVPPRRDDTGTQDMTMTIDALSLEAVEQLDRQAVATREAVRVIYRVYVASDLSAPAIKLACVLKNPRVNATRFSAQAVFTDPVNRQFPSINYTLREFPGLV